MGGLSAETSALIVTHSASTVVQTVVLHVRQDTSQLEANAKLVPWLFPTQDAFSVYQINAQHAS